MDSITQAALGAAIGEVLLGKKIGKKGAFIGAIVATIPDLDIIVFPFLSPLTRLSFHRGYSHSILFSIVGALILTYIFKRIKWTKGIDDNRLLTFAFLCLITHMLLDAFTSYGTLLYLPFSDARVGFDSINVVDPVYTLPLLVGLICSLWIFRKSEYSALFNRIGLIVSTVYLCMTFVVKAKVNDLIISSLTQDKIEYVDLMTQPVGIGSLHWYGVAKSKDGIHIGHYSFIDQHEIQFTFFPFQDELLKDSDPHMVERMKWFAKGYYHVVLEDDVIKFYNMQVDMQGIQQLENRMAPTRGYFTITKSNSGIDELDSGRHTY